MSILRFTARALFATWMLCLDFAFVLIATRLLNGPWWSVALALTTFWVVVAMNLMLVLSYFKPTPTINFKNIPLLCEES